MVLTALWQPGSLVAGQSSDSHDRGGPATYRMTTRHFIFRDPARNGEIVAALDAADAEAAHQRLRMLVASPPANLQVESRSPVRGLGGSCILAHTVGERPIIRPAPDTKPKSKSRVHLSPHRTPQVRLTLAPDVTARKYHNTCFYCGFDMEGETGDRRRTRDHVTPRCRGGRVKVPCCHKCNTLKGNLNLEEYRVLVAYRNGLVPIEILRLVKFKGEETAKVTEDA
jgi:hypothetical protein